MKNNFTLVRTFLLIFCFGVTIALSAQVQFNYVPSQVLAASGQTDYQIDVRLSDFDDVLTAQFALAWDPSVLKIDSILNLNPNLPGFNSTSYALPSQTYDMIPGKVNFSWVSQTISGVTLPDNSLFFTMKFTVVGDPCDFTNLAFFENEVITTEFINGNFVDIGAVEPLFTIEVAGTDCNNFQTNLSCNALVNVSLNPWNGEAVLTPDMILEGGPYNYSNMTVSPEKLTCDDVGTEVTVTVTDNSTGNMCWGKMRPEDKTPPVAISLEKSIVVLSAASPGQLPTARLLAETVDNGSWDNCTDVTFSPQYWDFDCSDIGIQDVVLTVSDGYGNFNSVITTVQVLSPDGGCDGFVETMACNDFVNITVGPFSSEIELAPDMLLEGGPYDFSVMEISPSTVSCDDVNMLTNYTVTNTENGNSCFGLIKVQDALPPVVVVKENIVISLTQPSNGGAVTAKLYAESVNNGTYDNCSEVTLSPPFWEFDCSDIGQERFVTLTATDASGNISSAWTEVTVEFKPITGAEFTCPDDIIVDCTIDINDVSVIENILGSSAVVDGCILPYNDVEGFDANEDGDIDDMHSINGEMITEGFSPCQFGTVVRTWASPGSTDAACVQLIGIRQTGDYFDGATMIDWPYSKNAIVDLGDNDTGSNCSGGCNPVDANDIELVYDNDGTLVGCNLSADCTSALCEAPLFEIFSCSLVGYSTEETKFNLPNGDLRIVKVVTVVDWCAYDPDVSQETGLWTYTIDAIIAGGANSVSFSGAEVSGKKGETVCLPISVENFKDIESFQGSLSWDESVASFSSVGSFSLPGMNSSSFGLFDSANGKLSYLWIDQTGTTPASLIDGSVLFNVCFDIIGDEGETTDVTFENSPTEIEVSSGFTNLPFVTNSGKISITDGSCAGDLVSPTPYCINLSTALMTNGQVELWAIDFNIGSFDNCTPSNNLRYTFTDVDPSNDPNFSGNSSSKIYTAADINFQTNATITERMYVWDENGNSDYCSINLTLVNNSSTGGGDIVNIEFDDVTTSVGSTVCVPLRVKNFNNIESFQGSVNWDPSVAKYKNLSGFNLPGLSSSTFNTNNVNNGNLAFLWFDNTGVSPVSLNDNSSVFEVCFEAVGSPGDVTDIAVSNNPISVEVTDPGNINSLPYSLVAGQFSILNGNCSIEESQIMWPLQEITVSLSVVTPSTSPDLLSPDNLLTFTGIEYADVYPTFDIPAECENSIAYTYDDTVIPVTPELVKVLREWTVLDWNTGSIFTFAQVIRNTISGAGICDTLPNSAPFGDCDSGHTGEDDVEWPDDLSIADHRITPSELVTVSGVDPEDAKPFFYNVPELYLATYADSVGGLSPTNLSIKRIWSVNRTDFPGQTWKYIQCIDVDLTDFGNLVTVSTLGNRPLSNVVLNTTDMTNEEGFAYVEDEANPSRSDMLRNGLNIKDMMMIQAYFQGDLALSDNQIIAADFSNDGNVNALDMIQVRKLLLGIDADSAIDWMFNDAKSEIESGLEPKGHYVAIKRGDVDDSADIGLENPVYLTQDLIFEDQLLNAGELYSVPLYIGSNMQALGTELNLTFNNEKVEITGVNSDQVFGSVSYNVIDDSRLAMITENAGLEIELLDSETPLLTIEFLATENGTLKEVFGVSSIDESFILDIDYNLIKINELVEGGIILDNENLDKTLAIDVYPNPAVDYLVVEDYNAFAGQDVRFELFDLAGKRILTTVNQKQVTIAQLVPGMYIYKVTVDNKFTSGRIMKQ